VWAERQNLEYKGGGRLIDGMGWIEWEKGERESTAARVRSGGAEDRCIESSKRNSHLCFCYSTRYVG